ncbi:hypothetical protein AB0L63_10540 [Nocardia sp. NPDC051990]|uniref:hypothetical protein n=1 Tax=Nocardia sp. NPDC051990 TaxID=3155285 RepID=UPI0034480EDE
MTSNESSRGYWKPERGMDFHRVLVSADRGHLRESCEVFANYLPDAMGQRQIQVSLHKEHNFAAVLHMAMTVDDAVAVVGVLQAAIGQATGGQGDGEDLS